MPQVPYNSVPRVGLAPLPGVRQNPNAPIEAFGGGVASQPVDLSGVANVANQEGRERQRIRMEAAAEADQVATTHGYSATVVGSNEILHGENGVLNRRGSDAFTIDQEAYDRYGQMVAGIRESMGTDRQKAIYDKMVLSQWNQIDNQVQTHIAAQRRVFDKQGTDAGIEANNNKVQASYSDPAIVDDAIEHNQALAAGYLKRQGAPDEEITNKKADIESKMRLDVLKQYVDNGQDLSASAYLTKYKDKFVGDTLVKAETLTKRGSTEGEAIRQADAITSAAKDENDAFAKAASIAEPLVREKAEQRISLYYNRKTAGTRKAQEDAFQSGYQTLRNNGWDLSSVPVSVRNSMGAAHEENLVRASEHGQKVVLDGGVGDPEQMTQLRNEAYFNPDQFASRNLLEVPGLSRKQREQLQNLQRTVGGRVQRTDEAAILKGMAATTKAIKAGDMAPPDTANTGALNRDAALDASLGIGGKSHATPAPEAKKPLAPSMVAEIVANAGNGGKDYAEFLRMHGFDVPDDVDAFIAAELAKAAAEQAKAQPAKPKKKP